MNIAIISKLKQGDIVKAMKERNWTQGKTAEFLGVSQQTFGRLLNLKWVPKNFPEDLTVKLLELTGKLPDELFPEAFREPEFLSLDKTAIAYAQGNPELVAGLIPKQLNAASSDDLIDRVELQAAFEKVLPTLTPRQQLVIRGRFFEDRTLEDVAKEMGISRDRVRQIEAKALRDLRHPSRSRILKPFVKV